MSQLIGSKKDYADVMGAVYADTCKSNNVDCARAYDIFTKVLSDCPYRLG